MTRVPANNPCADGVPASSRASYNVVIRAGGRLSAILRLWLFDPPQEIKDISTEGQRAKFTAICITTAATQISTELIKQVLQWSNYQSNEPGENLLF